MTPEKE
jgi:hypothetical protein